LIFAALVGCLVLQPAVPAQDQQADPNVEVLTRGPVHEAYANAVSTQPAPGLFAPKGPPEPIEELPPAEKPTGENVQWIPGYWAWDEDKSDYLWVSGFWRSPPPGRTWVPGAWRDAGDGHWQWTSGFWNAVAQADLQYLPKPPAPIEAAVPPSPGPNYVYAPGTWVYGDTHYVWRPGFYYVYRPGWVYIPAHFAWTPYGYIFVDGYWDYPLRERGVLFTPVYFRAGYYGRPGFVYTPSYVVYDDALYGALFVRPGGGYYFGDYFEARYTALGYRSWFSISIGVGGRDPYPYRYDPLFVYYRRTNGPNWALQVNNVYVERERFPDRRPPRTLVQQNVVVNNITNNTTVINNNTTVNNVKNVTMVAPITKVDKNVVNLTRITPQQQQQAAQSAKETRQVATLRAKAEAQLAQTGGGASAPLAPRSLKLDLPKSATTATTASSPATAPPPLPHTPVHAATNTTPPTGGKPPVTGNNPPGRAATTLPPPTTPGAGNKTPTLAPPSGSANKLPATSLPMPLNPPPKVGPMPPSGQAPLQPGQAPKSGTPMPPGSTPGQAGQSPKTLLPATQPPGGRPMPPGQQPPQHQPPQDRRPNDKDKDRDRPPQ
jgi:hypothetical protein